jgi:hypothetical protein
MKKRSTDGGRGILKRLVFPPKDGGIRRFFEMAGSM